MLCGSLGRDGSVIRCDRVSNIVVIVRGRGVDTVTCCIVNTKITFIAAMTTASSKTQQLSNSG